jgi:hypothetical protein
MFGPDHQDLGPPKPSQGEHPAMPGQNLVISIDQNRDEIAEGLDAPSDLLHLPIAMLLWVPRVGFEFADRQRLDLEGSSSVFRHLYLLSERPGGRSSGG